jgi:hypothetical protein
MKTLKFIKRYFPVIVATVILIGIVYLLIHEFA